MKVILCENVPNLGEIGATVKVTPGYARNFLLPRKLAVSIDSGSAKQLEHEMRIIRRREEKLKVELAAQAKVLEGLTIEIKARAGEEDKLFGSVTNANIADGLKALGHPTDRKSIALEEPIKTLGIHTVRVKLGKGVEASVKVWVSKEAEPVAEVIEETAAAETEAEASE